MMMMTKRVSALILILSYPLYYLLYYIANGTIEKECQYIEWPSDIWFILLCAGVVLAFYSDRKLKLQGLVVFNYLGYLIVYISDLIFRWIGEVDKIFAEYYKLTNNKLVLYAPVILIITILLCLLYLLLISLRHKA